MWSENNESPPGDCDIGEKIRSVLLDPESENNESPPGDCDDCLSLGWWCASICQKTTNPRQGIATDTSKPLAYSVRLSVRKRRIPARGLRPFFRRVGLGSGPGVRKQRIPARGLRLVLSALPKFQNVRSENNESPPGDCDSLGISIIARSTAVSENNESPPGDCDWRASIRKLRWRSSQKTTNPRQGIATVLRRSTPVPLLSVRKQRIPARGLRLVELLLVVVEVFHVRKHRILARGLRHVWQIPQIATQTQSENNESPPGDCDGEVGFAKANMRDESGQKTTNPRQGIATGVAWAVCGTWHLSENNESPPGDCDLWLRRDAC